MFLAHHGITGQKWGEKNGPPYPLHYSQKSAAEKKRGKSDAQKESERIKRYDSKNRGTLTEAEINERIRRMEAEIRLKELTDKDINSGKKIVKDMLIRTGERVVGTALAGAALYGMKVLITKNVTNWNDDAEWVNVVKGFGEAIFNGGPKKK